MSPMSLAWYLAESILRATDEPVDARVLSSLAAAIYNALKLGG